MRMPSRHRHPPPPPLRWCTGSARGSRRGGIFILSCTGVLQRAGNCLDVKRKTNPDDLCLIRVTLVSRQHGGIASHRHIIAHRHFAFAFCVCLRSPKKMTVVTFFLGMGTEVRWAVQWKAGSRSRGQKNKTWEVQKKKYFQAGPCATRRIRRERTAGHQPRPLIRLFCAEHSYRARESGCLIGTNPAP